MATDPKTTSRAELPPLPDEFEYGLELGECMRLAALLGHRAADEPPISFSSMLIAFLIHDRPVSRWFQDFVKAKRVDSAAILAERSVNPRQLPAIRKLVASGDLPTTEPFMSQSFGRVLGNAVDIANQVGRGHKTLGGRHIMAAYAIHQLPDHVERVLRWGIDPQVWKREFLTYAVKEYPEEAWEDYARNVYGGADWRQEAPAAAPIGATNKRAPSKKGGFEENAPAADAPAEVQQTTTPPPGPTTLYSEFGADNPFASNIADLLKVDSEASAFARLVAAKDISPPLAIGIFGEWGSGKTFFMRRMHENIQALSDRAKDLKGDAAEQWPYLKDVVQIKFDAWHYAEENLWASLVDYIFAELDAWMLDKSRDDPAGVDHVLDRLATTQQLKLDALETLILRRSERQSAEARAAKARKKYQDAVKRREAIQPKSYLLSAIEAYAEQDSKLKELHTKAADALGIPELQEAGGRLESAITEARTEAGRAHLVTRSLFAKLGTAWGITTIVIVLVVIPALVVALKESLENVAVLAWLKEIKGSVFALATFVVGAAAKLSSLMNRARQGLDKLSKFDEELQKKIEDHRAELEKSAVANQDREAQQELQKSRQAFEAAEAALTLADANLLAARQDFESGTARGRLNQFIRSKVTSGEYAKHLGIVAAIRRDFMQLAALMNLSNDNAQEEEDRKKLAKDAEARVDRFITWLGKTKDVKLAIREVSELMNLLAPADAVKKLDAHLELFKGLLSEQPLPEQKSELEMLRDKLSFAAANPRELPRFSRIVLYIDDLDRCPAKKVVDVLQAVHLLLSFPLFAVVVAVDSRWVSRALRDHYPGLMANGDRVEEVEGQVRRLEKPEHTAMPDERRLMMDRALRSEDSGGARPYDYLEKIFQIPYWVRSMDKDAARDFVEGVASAKKKKREVPREVAANVDAANVAPSANSAAAAIANDAPESPGVGEPTQAAVPDITASPPSPPVLQQAAVLEDTTVHEGVSLEKAEIAMLKKFAPFVGDTPRRAIRFVNIYRLVKTSMPDNIRSGLVGVNGSGGLYRALIAQLAVANGMPQVASYFFEQVSRVSKESTLVELQTSIIADAEAYPPGTLQQLPALMMLLQVSGKDIPEAEDLSVVHMKEMIGFARRYSFERR